MIYAVCWVIFKTTNFLGAFILSIFKFQAMTLEMKHILSSWVTLIMIRVYILIFHTFLILHSTKLSCFISLKFLDIAFVNIYMSNQDFPTLFWDFAFRVEKWNFFFFLFSLPSFCLLSPSSFFFFFLLRYICFNWKWSWYINLFL